MRAITPIIRLITLFVLIWFLEQAVLNMVDRALFGLDDSLQLGIKAFYWGLPLFFVMEAVLRSFSRRRPTFKSFSRTYVVSWFFGQILMVPFILLVNLLSFFPDLDKYWFLVIDRLGFGVGIYVILLFIFGMFRNRYRYKIHRHEVPIEGLPEALEGFRLVQISDIHSGSFDENHQIEKGIELINGLHPDLVCFTGDLVNSKASEIEPFISIFNKIKAPHGVFSILGNHDYGDYSPWPDKEAKETNFRRLLDNHKKLGWKLLRNEHDTIDIGGKKIAIVGVENYSASGRFHRYGDLAQALRGMQDTEVKILLSHDPSHWEDQVLKDYPDISLTLSGHTHGFQFGFEWGPVLRWSPARWAYKQWAGLYRNGKQFLYVNRGFGFLGYHGRVGILPEITLLQLVKQK